MAKIKNLLFTPDMAKALYFGFKTETRRLKAQFEVGDLIRVRETYYVQKHGSDFLFYGDFLEGGKAAWNLIPGIHMKNEHARMYLEVTAVKREPLCDITEVGAAHEGVEMLPTGFYRNYQKKTAFCETPRESFITLWDSINGVQKGDKAPILFSSNPWVHVTQFDLVTRNGILPEKYMEVFQNG
jgi:hypothetical protein